jgi:hypothetical protein
MKEIIIDLGTKFNTIQIIPLADGHLGDENCDLNLFKKTIDYIKNTPNCYAILNGDLINNALKTSKSDIYKENMTMAKQQELLIDLLLPIKDKILVISPGNHERRTELASGVNPLWFVARILGLSDRYAEGQYTLTVLFGKYKSSNTQRNSVVIQGVHGTGGGSTIGGKANAMLKLGEILANADIYITAHTHQIIDIPDAIFIYNPLTRKVEKHIRQFFNCNSFVKYGGYAEEKMYAPTDTEPRMLLIKAVREKETMRNIIDVLHIF